MDTLDRDLLVAESSAAEEVSPQPLSDEGNSHHVPSDVESGLDPVELSRIVTYRLQHRTTVGSVHGAVSKERWLPLGAGKPYPPMLPDSEEYLVEFTGPQDPLHPQNWSTSKRFGLIPVGLVI
jgi:hypothetical protein